jgi:2-polyprenyl-6-hydroxyphenyl methylase/3-demethylubiquinone-9 3-methyltransferase
MWQALENAALPVAGGGKLFVAIYNDQGRRSRTWLRIKQFYNFLPRSLRWLILLITMFQLWGPSTVRDILHGKPFYTWRHYAENETRGMSPWHDVVDWVGGLPFEVAKPEEIFNFFKSRGFELQRLKTCAGGLGCNELVFCKLR